MGGGRQGEVMVFEDPKKKTGRAEPGAAQSIPSEQYNVGGTKTHTQDPFEI